jgi:hypothetical protein
MSTKVRLFCLKCVFLFNLRALSFAVRPIPENNNHYPVPIFFRPSKPMSSLYRSTKCQILILTRYTVDSGTICRCVSLSVEITTIPDAWCPLIVFITAVNFSLRSQKSTAQKHHRSFGLLVFTRTPTPSLKQ